jgi:hypothetical protein
MADTKISALTDGSPLASGDQLVIARSGANFNIAASRVAGYQWDYVTQTSDLTVSATTAATAQAFLTGNSVSYDGATRVQLEWWSPSVSGTGVAVAELYDGATDQSLRIGQAGPGASGSPVYGVYFFTPSNASHTYSIKFWRVTANMTVSGNGGGIYAPAFLRVTTA